jgi:alkylation response protein AidB-like acyl-CoA dehydrogenase
MSSRIRSLTEFDVADFAFGCALLGTGGGGSVGGASLEVAHAIREFGPVPVVELHELPRDGLVMPPAGADVQPLQLEVYRAQRVIPQLVLDATTTLFEVGGASAVSRGLALDRHWRKVRTIAAHNPVAQRTRAVGQFELNGTLPDWKAPGAARVHA